MALVSRDDCPVADIAKTVGPAGRQYFGQYVAGDCLGAFASSRPRRGPLGLADRRLFGPVWVLAPDFN